jgi:hypothetical protein
VDHDTVADLAPLGLADVDFDEGVWCHPSIVARYRPSDNVTSSIRWRRRLPRYDAGLDRDR